MIPLQIFRSKKIALSSIDSPRRDVGWRLLIAKKLADEGVTTVLGKPQDILLCISLMQGGLIFGRFGGNTGKGKFDLDLIEQLEKTKAVMHFIHDEGAFYYKDEYDSAVKRIYPEDYFSRNFLKKVYFWGEKQRSVFKESYKDCSLEVIGAPRLDYLRFIKKKIDDRNEESAKKFVLVCSRFAGISPARDDISLISDNFLSIRMQAEGQGSKSAGVLFREQVKRWCAVSIDRAEFISAIYDLASNAPKIQFVFRPHPGEDASLYRSLFRFLDNVKVDKAGDLSSVLQGAIMFIHSESTSGVEASVSEVPSINFLSKSSGEHSVAGASEVGEGVENFDELSSAFYRLLSSSKSNLIKDAKVLSPYVKNSQKEFSAVNKIIDDILVYFGANNSNFKPFGPGLSRIYYYYLCRKFFYFIKSFIFKGGSDDKVADFNKASIKAHWELLGGRVEQISVLLGVVVIFPANK